MPSNVITIAHSPDSDDAFMFYALAKHKINCGGFEFRHVLSDIETLNRQAMEEKYEIMGLAVTLTNKYALRMYEKFGFEFLDIFYEFMEL